MESILWIPASYWAQARLAFSRWVFVAVFLLVVFCFAFSAMPRAYAAELIVVLGALTLRDGYMHNRKLKEGVSSNVQFSEQSIGDAAIAGLLAFVAWAVLRGVSPSSAMPFPNLWRGAVTLMGTLFTLKMMLMVDPNPNAPLFNKRSWSAKRRGTQEAQEAQERGLPSCASCASCVPAPNILYTDDHSFIPLPSPVLRESAPVQV